jgi:hypothetical protein
MQQGLNHKLNLYETDFFAWTQEQAKLIKKKAFNDLDIKHLFDEVMSMGTREKSELTSRLTVLLMHLLKWKYQPSRQCRSWQLTIDEQRDQIKYHLADNLSLTNPQYLETSLQRAFKSAVREAFIETELEEKLFPKKCEWMIEQILNVKFFPK